MYMILTGGLVAFTYDKAKKYTNERELSEVRLGVFWNIVGLI
jgi:hypothetical protein